jgi:hypothetical protein
MAATIQRKGVLTGMVTTVVGVAIALPFTLIHPVLPFSVLLIGLGLVLLMRRWRWFSQYPTGFFVGGLVALILLLPAVSIVKFAEQGFDDGPFAGEIYTGGVTGLPISERLAYRNGELVIYNRQANNPPVLAFQVGDELQWARELDVSQNPRYEGYQLATIAEPQLAYGIVRDRLDFSAKWNFGTERGRAYLWKWGGLHRFYLSW